MMRVCLIGCLFLVFGCGNDAGAGGDAGIDDGGQLPDADICDSVECECDTDDDCGAHEVCDTSSGPGRVCVCAPAYERHPEERFSMPLRRAATIPAR
ncbi:MAG: hypothetical protein JRJ80_13850 [Deltaproteobacteria bacterium]|nr:hypothetical protein [Deltaproteobacteria bacterium]